MKSNRFDRIWIIEHFYILREFYKKINNIKKIPSRNSENEKVNRQSRKLNDYARRQKQKGNK